MYGFSFCLAGGPITTPHKSYATPARALQGACSYISRLPDISCVASLYVLEVFEWYSDLPLWLRGSLVSRWTNLPLQQLCLCRVVANAL